LDRVKDALGELLRLFNQLRQLVDLLLTPELLTVVLCSFIAHLSFLLFASELLRHWEEEGNRWREEAGNCHAGLDTRHCTLAYNTQTII